ncbi:hypothetical protein RCL1_000259 [Eukaryota sp. TZLM3-RCL]
MEDTSLPIPSISSSLVSYEQSVISQQNENTILELQNEAESLRAQLAADNFSGSTATREKNALKKRLRKVELTIESLSLPEDDEDIEASSLFGETLFTSEVVSDLLPEEHESEEDLESQLINIGSFKCVKEHWDNLFSYQKDGVKWLLSGFNSNVLGILADEMGLGKTIQVLAFLECLLKSDVFNSAIILVPATVLENWEREAEIWCPDVDVILLHSISSTRSISDRLQSVRRKYFDSNISYTFNSRRGGVSGLIVVTTYETFRLYSPEILRLNFQILILDEGHRIKNCDADITLTVKTVETPLRLLLSGTPIMNSLKELWSLIDFVLPGKLGTYDVFKETFELPIVSGGYSSATQVAVKTAVRCAAGLRDLIKPLLLRRLKSKVLTLPDKQERILFCKLSDVQARDYNNYISSPGVRQLIINPKLSALPAISILRNICNHPNIPRATLEQPLLATDYPPSHYSNYSLSGKMQILAQMLPTFKESNSKVLIFSQTITFSNYIADFLEGNNYTFLKMDGKTPMSHRLALVDSFNTDPNIFCFVMTTRVGGLGLNITGANVVLLMNPDFNPKIDTQATERSWRVGQTRNVQIYRFITAGTIEEKVLHRQIFKTYLISRVLSNPSQRRFFSKSDLRDLFTFYKVPDEEQSNIDTLNLFPQSKIEPSKPPPPPDEASSVEDDLTLPESHNLSVHSDPVTASVKRPVMSNNEDITSFLALSGSIASVIDHTSVEQGIADDATTLDAKAEELAEQAVLQLRESGILRGKEDFAVPTFTGKFGQAGKSSQKSSTFRSALSKYKSEIAVIGPSPKNLVSLSQVGTKRTSSSLPSSLLLTSLKKGFILSQEVDSEASNASVDLAKDLHEFITSHEEGVASSVIVQRYSGTEFCKGEGALLLKKTLSALAELRDGQWFVKNS